jgi:hypothetical protein
MTRLKSLPLAAGALILSGGAVLAFSALPSAAGPGLATASAAAGRTVPARSVSVDPPAIDPAVDSAADLPDAASHGATVSTIATSDDPTTATNRRADVSAAAKDNHGQTVAAAHKPSTAGKPDSAGKPDGAGAPDGAGKPAGAGKPDDPGIPADPGAPDGAGKPEGLPARP